MASAFRIACGGKPAFKSLKRLNRRRKAAVNAGRDGADSGHPALIFERFATPAHKR
jgi:hypothetical protein